MELALKRREKEPDGVWAVVRSASSEEVAEKLGKGQGMRRQAGGGKGKGKRLRSGQQ